MPASDQQRTFQFGVFHLNSATRELRKHGVKLKLQEQPLQVLTLLLENAGEVVTREEIQERLWPENTFVDFDNAINSAVRKLRDALSDTAENPRFIETLARRGYRFIPPVAGNRTTAAPEAAVRRPKPSFAKRWFLPLTIASVLIVLALMGGIRYWIAHHTRTVTDDAAAPLPLTSYPGFQRFPTFSPEGTRVAFAWDEPGKRPSNIYVKLIGSSEPIRLTNNSTGDFAPAWSPDGRSIAFLRRHGASKFGVVLIPAVGGHERELAQVQLNAEQIFNFWGWIPPTPYLGWSPDGRWLLAVDRKDSNSPHQIIRLSVETGEKRILLPAPPESDGDAGIAISPDGKSLAFARMLDMPAEDVYVISLAADMRPISAPKRLTNDGKRIGGIAWAPDGLSVVFTSERRGFLETWRVSSVSPAEPMRINAAGDNPMDLIISRTGRHLVYSHWFDDSNIWRVDLKGKSRADDVIKLISSTKNDWRPSYSADSRRIAFESNRSGSEEIWICDEDGSNPVQLTFFGKAHAGSPAWSPDGKRIAFDCDASGNWDVYVVSSEGGKPVRLTTSSGKDIRPLWSHDGRWIYYMSTRTGKPQIWKMPTAGGPSIQVTKNGGLDVLESPDGADLYYTKPESGLWKMSLQDGTEVKISSSSDAHHCGAARGGLYCAENSRTQTTIYFVDSNNKTQRALFSVPGRMDNGFTISPDERWLLYSKRDLAGSDLMLVENFH